jgi:hypothetical protein
VLVVSMHVPLQNEGVAIGHAAQANAPPSVAAQRGVPPSGLHEVLQAPQLETESVATQARSHSIPASHA